MHPLTKKLNYGCETPETNRTKMHDIKKNPKKMRKIPKATIPINEIPQKLPKLQDTKSRKIRKTCLPIGENRDGSIFTIVCDLLLMFQILCLRR